MKNKTLLFFIFFFSFFKIANAQAQSRELIYLNEERLAKVKEAIRNGEPYYLDAYKKLITEAEKSLNFKSDPVVNKTIVPPSGDKHDYISIAPYFWPDSTKKDGLPWISHDGKVNPLTRGTNTDQVRTAEMWDALEILSLAYYFTKEVRFADKAKSIIHTWFVDPETKVNPNINYGQSVPGATTGRPFGVIEWTGSRHLITTMQLLERNNQLHPSEIEKVNVWITAYADWLTTSKIGQGEGRQANNHGNWYDYQIIGILRYLGKNEQARQLALNTKKRIATQIEPDGAMPLELKRTKSIYYSEMSLRALIMVSEIAKSLGVDLYNYETADGRSIKQGLNFLKPYALKEEVWTYKQITSGGVNKAIEDRLKPLFSIAGSVYNTSLLNPETEPEKGLSYLQKLQFPVIK